MKSSTIVLIVAVVLIAGVYFYIQKVDGDRHRLVTQLAAASATPNQPASYTEPVIGMSYAAFKDFCGSDRIDGDDIRQTTSANGTVYVMERKYSSERAKRSCWGTFYIDTAKGITMINR